MSNPNTLPWTMYQDIQIPELDIKKQFDEHISAGRYAEALQVLRTDEQKLKGRAYVANSINELFSAVYTLERYYHLGVVSFLNGALITYSKMINEFTNAGYWSSETIYRPYNFVFFNDKVYMCYKKGPIGTPPLNPTYWVKLGLVGEVGASGMDVNMQYQWNPVKGYLERDIVAFDENLYIAKKPSTNIQPDTDPNTWALFVATAKGKIEYGINPPANPVQNMIWFKTDVDPLASTSPVVGIMLRYRVDGTWEEMYPMTAFGLIQGREKYSPKQTIGKTELRVDDWGLLNGEYVIRITDSAILENSYVEVMPTEMSPQAYGFYSNLGLTVETGVVVFTSRQKPNVNIPIQIRIQ